MHVVLGLADIVVTFLVWVEVGSMKVLCFPVNFVFI